MICIDVLEFSKVSEEDITFIKQILPDNFKRRVNGTLISNKKSLLGRFLLYLNCLEYTLEDLDKLVFALKGEGKLYIENYKEFNISHGSNFVVLAMSETIETIEIGVDIEKNRALNTLPDLMKYYSKEEQAAINENKFRASEMFLKLWTRKEAFYKAIGTGIYFNGSLKKVNTLQDKVHYNHQDWHFNTMYFKNNYWITCVSNKQQEIKLEERNIETFKKNINAIEQHY